MSTKGRRKKLSQEEIDQRVVAQADDDSAWEKPIKVKRARGTALSLSGDLAARAAFLAKLHREGRVDEWLARIIRERIELEELAFVQAKRELAAKASR
jgi:hypothetical protein